MYSPQVGSPQREPRQSLDICPPVLPTIDRQAPATRVDFFIAGMQKGGTTALDQVLRQHPQIQMARVKEVHHFDNEDIDWDDPDHSPLHDAFDWSVPDVVRGEATPSYTFWPNGLARLRRYNPEAKLIVGLRHPTFRAFSHWRMEAGRARERLPFQYAIGPLGRARIEDTTSSAYKSFSYIERGFYSWQILDLIRQFSRKRVFFFRTDHLWMRPGPLLAEIQDFLGVDREIGQRRSYVVPFDSREIGVLDPGDRKAINDFYESEIHLTASLAGIDLSDWLTPDYKEPMAAG